jgi:cyclohexa-1,5-dienecarbonyl-CoA hydratase
VICITIQFPLAKVANTIFYNGDKMNQKNFENIIFETKQDRAFLTINRAPLNILNISTMEEINEALSSLFGNKEVKVLVISGSGEKAFSAGVDVVDHTEDKVEKMLQVFHDVFRNLSKLDQVTVAALKGLTLGGGCEIAIFCDLIFAADNLKIGQPEIKLSVLPPIALLIMPRLVGLKKASELLLTGKTIEAQEAERIGLVNKVVSLSSFDSELESFIQPFTELSLVGLKYSKKGINLGLETNFLEGLDRIEKIYLEELMTSEDAHEGLKAFMEKRKPLWKNR